MWASEGEKVTLSAGELLADTGALTVGVSNATILVFSNTALNLELVRRNAANTADDRVQPFYVTGSNTEKITMPFPIGSINQRFQVRSKYAVEELSITASIIYS